jgi:hypothetical protein
LGWAAGLNERGLTLMVARDHGLFVAYAGGHFDWTLSSHQK